jgi:hypothetical protein
LVASTAFSCNFFLIERGFKILRWQHIQHRKAIQVYAVRSTLRFAKCMSGTSTIHAVYFVWDSIIRTKEYVGVGVAGGRPSFTAAARYLILV